MTIHKREKLLVEILCDIFYLIFNRAIFKLSDIDTFSTIISGGKHEI